MCNYLEGILASARPQLHTGTCAQWLTGSAWPRATDGKSERSAPTDNEGVCDARGFGFKD